MKTEILFCDVCGEQLVPGYAKDTEVWQRNVKGYLVPLDICTDCQNEIQKTIERLGGENEIKKDGNEINCDN